MAIDANDRLSRYANSYPHIALMATGFAAPPLMLLGMLGCELLRISGILVPLFLVSVFFVVLVFVYRRVPQFSLVTRRRIAMTYYVAGPAFFTAVLTGVIISTLAPDWVSAIACAVGGIIGAYLARNYALTSP